jgi:transposase
VPRRQQLSSFLLRQGCITGGRLGRSCIAAGSRGSSYITARGASYRAGGLHSGGRRRRSSARSAYSTDRSDAPDWRLAPVVAARQTMCSMALVNAATLIAELGDLSRFGNPRQLMACLGLEPSEHSGGASVRRGGLYVPIPSVGSAASCCFGRKCSPASSTRSPGRHSRGGARYRTFSRSGKPANIVTAAIARGLAAFVWDFAAPRSPFLPNGFAASHRRPFCQTDSPHRPPATELFPPPPPRC